MAVELSDIFQTAKSIPVPPIWQRRDSDWLRLVSPLDISGATIEGLRFTISALIDLPDRAVTFQIEYFPPPRENIKGGPLCRYEWRPLSAHNNKNLGPMEFRFLRIADSHIHPFDLNWLESPASVKRGNLPIAIPVRDSASFEEALDFACKEFRIDGGSVVPPPPWEVRLL